MARILVTTDGQIFFVKRNKTTYCPVLSVLILLYLLLVSCRPAGFRDGFRYHPHLKIIWGKF